VQIPVVRISELQHLVQVWGTQSEKGAIRFSEDRVDYACVKKAVLSAYALPLKAEHTGSIRSYPSVPKGWKYRFRVEKVASPF
jgi:hypothetical protein